MKIEDNELIQEMISQCIEGDDFVARAALADILEENEDHRHQKIRFFLKANELCKERVTERFPPYARGEYDYNIPIRDQYYTPILTQAGGENVPTLSRLMILLAYRNLYRDASGGTNWDVTSEGARIAINLCEFYWYRLIPRKAIQQALKVFRETVYSTNRLPSEGDPPTPIPSDLYVLRVRSPYYILSKFHHGAKSKEESSTTEVTGSIRQSFSVAACNSDNGYAWGPYCGHRFLMQLCMEIVDWVMRTGELVIPKEK